jgi:hypothetical protein
MKKTSDSILEDARVCLKIFPQKERLESKALSTWNEVCWMQRK